MTEMAEKLASKHTRREIEEMAEKLGIDTIGVSKLKLSESIIEAKKKLSAAEKTKTKAKVESRPVQSKTGVFALKVDIGKKVTEIDSFASELQTNAMEMQAKGIVEMQKGVIEMQKGINAQISENEKGAAKMRTGVKELQKGIAQMRADIEKKNLEIQKGVIEMHRGTEDIRKGIDEKRNGYMEFQNNTI